MVVGPTGPKDGVVGTHTGCELRIAAGKNIRMAAKSGLRTNLARPLVDVKPEELFISVSVIFVQLLMMYSS